MDNYVVFRVAKLKNRGNIAGAASHNLRHMAVPNADPERRELNHIRGPKTVQGVLDAYDKKTQGITIRKNAVMASEVLITASPTFFTEGAKEGEKWNPERLKQWTSAVEPWIREKFPHAISVALHLDEKTPHYQIIDVPIDPDTGRLSHRNKYGGDRQTLRDWQTAAAEPVQHLGIKRGVMKSKAKHVSVKQFYADLEKELAEIPEVKTPKPDPLPPKKGLENIPFTDAAKQREALEKEHKKQLKQHRTEARKAGAAALQAMPTIINKAKATELLKKEVVETKATLSVVNDERRKLGAKAKSLSVDLQTTKAEMKQQADAMRALPLGDVLERVYGAELKKGSKPEHKTRHYALPSGEDVAVSPARMGGEIFTIQGSDRGARGAINLVMELDGVGYKTALKTLQDSFGGDVASKEHRLRAIEKAVQEADKQSAEMLAPAPIEPPKSNENAWPRVKSWLENKRALPSKLVDWLKEKRLVYADARNNAVFPREYGGAFVRGTTAVKFHRTYGGRENGAYILPAQNGDKTAIICESAIDACSIKARRPDSLVIAVGGNLTSPESLKKHLSGDIKVYTAFDADEAGEDLTRRYKAVYPHAIQIKPVGKDWNEDLQSGAMQPATHWTQEAKETPETNKVSGSTKQRAAANKRPIQLPNKQHANRNRFSFSRPKF